MTGDAAAREPSVESYRRLIERLDRALLELYAARARTVTRLWEYKRRHGLPLHDPGQERRVVARSAEWARELGVAPAEAEALIREVMARSAPRPATSAESIDEAIPTAPPLVAH